jgi:hypothetical protein
MSFISVASTRISAAPSCTLMIGHRIMGISLLLTGNIAQGRGQLDEAAAL